MLLYFFTDASEVILPVKSTAKLDIFDKLNNLASELILPNKSANYTRDREQGKYSHTPDPKKLSFGQVTEVVFQGLGLCFSA